MSVEYRAPTTQTELDDTFECSARAFGGGDWALPFFTNIAIHDPWFRMENTRACFVDGKAVSVVQIFDRPMRIGNCMVRMGGIGSVGTDPEHRNKGHSLNVLMDCVRYMEDSAYDVSMLGTGVQSHYERAGWVVHPTYSWELTLPDRLRELPEGITIEQFAIERDLKGLMEIYDGFNRERTGTFARPENYWLQNPKWRTEPIFWIARTKDACVAYLRAANWSIREIGFLPGHRSAMLGLLTWFYQRAKVEEAQKVEAIVPSDLTEILRESGCSVRRRESTSWMIRIVRFRSLLEKIMPLLQTRIRGSIFEGWTGRIDLQYEADAASLDVRQGDLRISDAGQRSSCVLMSSQQQLMRLIVGNLSARQIASTNNLEISQEVGDFLEVIFPPDELFMWRTDSF
jgi:predicted acetyltransferase